MNQLFHQVCTCALTIVLGLAALAALVPGCGIGILGHRSVGKGRRRDIADEQTDLLLQMSAGLIVLPRGAEEIAFREAARELSEAFVTRGEKFGEVSLIKRFSTRVASSMLELSPSKSKAEVRRSLCEFWRIWTSGWDLDVFELAVDEAVAAV